MSERCEKVCKPIKYYNIVDHTRKHKNGIAASSLEELINFARIQYHISTDNNITVVLEQDGTEIDDEEYFATLEQNTNLMILYENKKWISAETTLISHFFLTVNNDCSIDKNSKYQYFHIKSIVYSLLNESSLIFLLTGVDTKRCNRKESDNISGIILNQ